MNVDRVMGNPQAVAMAASTLTVVRAHIRCTRDWTYAQEAIKLNGLGLKGYGLSDEDICELITIVEEEDEVDPANVPPPANPCRP